MKKFRLFSILLVIFFMMANSSYAFEKQQNISSLDADAIINEINLTSKNVKVKDLNINISSNSNNKITLSDISLGSEELTVVDGVYSKDINMLEGGTNAKANDVSIESVLVDLSMDSLTAATQPFVVGQDAEFQFKISNYGNYTAPNTNVGVKVDGYTVGLMNAGNISPGGYKIFSFYLSGVPEGLHEIELIALADASVIDTNPSNNNIIRNYSWKGVPDLVAKTFENISLSPIMPVGQDVVFRFIVSNEGTGSAVGTINNHLLVNGQQIGVIPITNLSVGATATITFSLTFSQPGTYDMLMHVNKNGTITESNYNNNTKTSTARVSLDVTNEYTLLMRQNAAYMAYYASIDIDMGTYPLLTGEEFASKVRPGGEWDYKLEYGYSNVYIYDGSPVTGEDMGNFHYGFVGRAATFGEDLLLSAAGAVQIYVGNWEPEWWSTYFDDPNDQAMIRYGISMWDNNSWPGGTINDYGAFSDNDEIYMLTEYEKRCIEREILQDTANLEKLKDK